MLRDITSTTNRRVPFPCLKESLNQDIEIHLAAKSGAKKVRFDADAMAKEKRQRKQSKVGGVDTPRRVRQQEAVAVGSSSTWNQDELDLFRVTEKSDIDVSEMIPQKFFDFSDLENYVTARSKLTSVQRADLSKRNVLMSKAGWFNWSFSSLHKFTSFQKTVTRMDNLSQKRSEKQHSQEYSQPDNSRLPISLMPPLVSQHPYRRLGPVPVPQSESEIRRIASISDPEKSSTGTKLVHACREEETQNLGNFFCEGALNELFNETPCVRWINGRPKAPVVQWRGEYLAAEIKLGPRRISARTDGGLQILLPQSGTLTLSSIYDEGDDAEEIFVEWDRSYYEIGLEAKRFFKSNAKDPDYISELGPDNSIHSGQVFAEMLGAACHPEFFNNSDVEAFIIYIQHTSFQLYHCYFPQTYLQHLYHTGEPSPSGGVTLSKTKPYNYADATERGEWFDVFVALVQYLLSGQSKVGYLNNSPGKWNLIHKSNEAEGGSAIGDEGVVTAVEASQHDVEARDNGEGGTKRKRTREKENPPVGGRRSQRIENKDNNEIGKKRSRRA